MTRRHATLTTALGELLVVADGDALAGIYFPGHWHPPTAGTIGVEVSARDDALIARLGVELDEYLTGARTEFDLPTAPDGDEFQHAVWGMLRGIPLGTTVTYGELAERLGDRNLARRVGGAVGRNPLSIIVPCHRVVGADGSLTGYAGGLERKRFLLELEGAPVVAQARLF
ncbi:methylated-DNA--[protein]-cysteine S-methyltransferase [Agromyces sp. H3Y2-19a]|uniref:methylated-DNA--[protein]-cysteine S-methyltransferase n=1 Tax=Agromyces TaxID=33877 RepID=UPI001E47289C|nr:MULTISPECIES: methylated-DNA--[protein]-cysteine S-methyltransferase [Agromyces]MCD5346056.1 methylated-DNA--[protein]-cysteine S-methyltransferase [Agromyces sp. S2-1-8]MDF0512419.1 methylated-DNA--[protein]-cysteine S-methyltransferase [Agromyces chromiiresistens]